MSGSYELIPSRPLLSRPKVSARCRIAAIACLTLSCWGGLVAAPAHALHIDVSLNLFYNNPHLASSGGTWQIAVKTDEFGLAGINVLLENVVTTTGTLNELAPVGKINGSDPAGFSRLIHGDDSVGGVIFTDFVMGQNPSGSPERGAFYGVGSIDDPDGGVPNYPGQLAAFPDSTSIGPSLTTLSNLSNLPWATTDPLGDSAWDSAALLFSGIFLPGETPAFFSEEDTTSSGVLYTTLPATSATIGDRTDVDSEEFTTVVRDDLSLVAGDYDGSGTVDAPDYTLWRDTLGQAVPVGLYADGNQNGLIDAGDYTIWKNNFGLQAGSGSLTAAAVPEPQTLVLLAISSLMAGVWGRRTRGNSSRCRSMK